MARREWFDYPVTDTPLSASFLNDLEARKPEAEYMAINVKDPPYNAVGNGIIDDTAAINAAIADLPFMGGEVYIPAGIYRITSTISLPKGCRLVGAGGTRNANTVGYPYANTHLDFENNGTGILVDSAVSSAWAVEKLCLHGNPTLASQDLLVIGTGAATFGGIVRDVTCDEAGRDGVVLNYALNVLFERVMARASTRHGWHFKSQSNANTLNRCYTGLSQQWGVYYDGGYDNTINMVIESNSWATGTDYGGIRVAAQSWGCVFTLLSCHFENNQGDTGTGVPIQVDTAAAHGGGPTVISEIDTEYAEVNGVVLNDGQWSSFGLRTVMSPHATLGAGHDGSVWVNPKPWGTPTSFDLTDNSGKSIVIGNTIVEGKPGIKIGDDVVIFRESPDLLKTTDEISFERASGERWMQMRRPGDANARMLMYETVMQWGPGNAAADTTIERSDVAGGGVVKISSALELVPRSATNVPNNTLFVDTTGNVLKFKDNGGTVRTVTVV